MYRCFTGVVEAKGRTISNQCQALLVLFCGKKNLFGEIFRLPITLLKFHGFEYQQTLMRADISGY